MAYTQADLDTLKQMLASGVLSARHGDKTIQFATVEDLVRRISIVTAELATQTTRRVCVGRARFTERT